MNIFFELALVYIHSTFTWHTSYLCPIRLADTITRIEVTGDSRNTSPIRLNSTRKTKFVVTEA